MHCIAAKKSRKLCSLVMNSYFKKQCVYRQRFEGCNVLNKVQSNPVNTDTEEVIESVRINGVSVLKVLNLEKM